MGIILQNPLFTQEIPDLGATKGHIRFTSQSCAVKDVGAICFAASIASAVLYEKVKAGGTTLIINLSKQGTKVDVLARMENDGMDLQWDIKPANKQQLEEVQERIKNKTFMLMHAPKDELVSKPASQAALASGSSSLPSGDNMTQNASGSSTPAIADKTGKKSAEDEEKEDYLSKQLIRIP